jgi:hypothetical protein
MLTLTKRVAVAVLAVLTQSALSGARGTIENLGWLAGTWQLESNGKRIEEHWTTPAGGMMLGTGRTLANGKTIEFEFLRIEQRADGLVYIAQPGGQPPTEFRLASSDADEWVFANPRHDFPNRIRYRRTGEKSLTARIEDESGAKHIDFSYTRVE